MPKCTINGKEVEVKAGTTIIQAFKEAEIDIAHYCWHPGLSIAGVCRLCMVSIEGQPKLQIACNTVVADGMKISNQTEQVKDTVRWGMDFHLINHPLDCPICDQAGECGLQEQYMKFGQYDPEMAEPKQKKHKVVDLGPKIVLDTERCILCSRCVRFTDEVSKTGELGIFNRGDRSEVGTFKDKPLDNNYSLNTVDICPVGALTSKDFRFRQRVWYLKKAQSVCTGCSTGCNVNVYFNEEGAWRVKPVYNEKVNGYWMCDKGRDVYKFVNKEVRLTEAKRGMSGQWLGLEAAAAAKEAGEKIRQTISKEGADKVAIVVTGQYTNEEYETLFNFFVKEQGVQSVYHWMNNPEDMDGFDGQLYRGDRNPNTKGLLASIKKFGKVSEWQELESKLKAGAVKYVVVAGPENSSVFPSLETKVNSIALAQNIVWLSAAKSAVVDSIKNTTYQIPLKTFIEKDGTYTNYAGLEQKVKRGTTIIAGALTLTEAVHLMSGEELDINLRPVPPKYLKTNFMTQERGSL
ncbi:MAG: (2Fe-2S)-binding protein [Bdellovibrionales bacterium]|nr:(2Fe-2S)-binding protein [Bdellovibrionales bacterium]